MTMTTTDIWCVIAIVFFVVVDYVTGTAKAILNNTLSSQKCDKAYGTSSPTSY